MIASDLRPLATVVDAGLNVRGDLRADADGQRGHHPAHRAAARGDQHRRPKAVAKGLTGTGIDTGDQR